MLMALLSIFLNTKSAMIESASIESRAINILNIPLPIYVGGYLSSLGGDKLNFLDVTIVKSNANLEFDWSHKPT